MSSLAPTVAAPSAPRPRVRGLLLHALLTAVCAVTLIVLLAAALARPLGFRVLVEHSDSMAPAIRTGDLLVAKDIPPREARVGDVISFHSPGTGRLLTHRVVSRRLQRDGRWTFVTRGDANSGTERWSVSTRGTMGQVVLRLPKAGYAVAWLSQPIWAVLLVGGGGLLLALMLARKIWSL